MQTAINIWAQGAWTMCLSKWNPAVHPFHPTWSLLSGIHSVRVRPSVQTVQWNVCPARSHCHSFTTLSTVEEAKPTSQERRSGSVKRGAISCERLFVSHDCGSNAPVSQTRTLRPANRKRTREAHVSTMTEACWCVSRWEVNCVGGS